ncbi:B3 domain-containing protein [Actinidia chinensis var. chinensis]|uniref:B3 domain-containing protein n=1 Tax=Actinidia chinensis var. chinensis TaxID=1590841 RepID=A0A2R6P812_ACTCC|nr:B3 domain-containing protein [Actinidia chinensis var. chinensis]
MKKTLYYNFIPTKAEEEECKATATPYNPSRDVVELRDIYPLPVFDPLNPWPIKKVLMPAEVGSGRIVLSHSEAFNCVFRYWTAETTHHVVIGQKKKSVLVWDVTEENNPTSYISEDMFLEQVGPDCEYYVLGCTELVRDRRLNAGDEIGLFWDMKTVAFQFKVLRRGP